MKVIVDTNVFISAVFFSGPPYEILKAWHDGKITLVISPEIFDEYDRVGQALGKKFPGVNIDRILDLILVESELVRVPPLSQPVCEDPDDDKFLACALATNTKVVISGDKKLLAVSGFSGVEVMRPRDFSDRYLS